MIKCKECKYFERGKWHKAVDPDEGPQMGGHCERLLKVLQLDNSKLIWLDKLYIQDGFGCVLGRKKGSEL